MSLLPIAALFALTATAEIPVENFAKQPTVTAMKLSPDGKHLATIVPQSDYETMLVVLDRQTMKRVGGLRSNQRRFIGDFWWVSDARIVVAVATKGGDLDTPYPTGELDAVDFDGKRLRRIYGQDGTMATGSRLNKRADDRGYAQLVDPLPDMPDVAAVAIWSRDPKDPFTDLVLMNVLNGHQRKVARAPVPYASFLVDNKGQVKYSWGDRDGWQQTYFRVGEEWKLINDEEESGFELNPISLGSGDKAYWHRLPVEGPGTIEIYDPNEDKATVLYTPKVAEPTALLSRADGSSVYGVITADDRFKLEILDKAAPEARIAASLSRSFQDQLVTPIDWSRDGKAGLFYVSSDRNSGEYYLFADGKAVFLLAQDEWSDPATMRPKAPINLKARDGTQLHGYLTKPAGDGKAPLIVMPHGGPHGVRDDASFDTWAQLLSNRGYAVLQINFRGSGGYGQKFGAAGYLQWGGAMIDDILDATNWVVEQGLADGERICAFGASYGGYASLMSAVRAPDMFKCVISYVGVSDLELMYSRGDAQESYDGEEYLERVIGRDKAQLREFSPVHHADKINAKVMLVHGGDDQRVPLVHADRMRDALEDAGHEVEWLLKSDEGHGFYRTEHKVELYNAVLAFLEQHSGP